MITTYLTHYIPAVTASDDRFLPVPADSSPYEVVSAVFLPWAVVAANDTNKWAVDLKATDGEAGSAGSSMGGFTTAATGGTALAVNDKVAITVSAANAQIPAGGSILIDIDETGTADALEGVLTIGIRKLPPA